ncbi:DUF922 domain-containing protein [Mucilaginibacter paludis]|uniref:DUF922 domain-containing protein n=1 Tax=Mucilaginibacter paludis DSM 18603 TaxID=714943 RepID=H1Y4L9_9SPHI|nr:hypothetical protein [Mucilaginibacter paludis]EHQ26803.1 hypothetical protein Mucpa_2690 [Mucilaginibacter paludis DSM 18603]
MKTKLSVLAISVGFLFFLSDGSVAQPYHRLAARDFAGSPTTEAGYAAYTNCYVSYSYRASRYNGNYSIDFSVQLYLNTNKSWIRFNEVNNREMLLGVLRHEQGHYNMAYLMKNELYSVFTHHRYSANYQAEVVLLFKQVETKYHQLNDDYESQTQHMANVKNQEKWNLWFEKQLDNAQVADNRHNGDRLPY